MRIAVLWTQLSGYLNASLRALAAKPGVKLYVANQAAGEVAPFASSQFGWVPRRYEYTGEPDAGRLLRELTEFAPEIILASWHVSVYQVCCRQFALRGLRVACADNPWRGTARQRVASLTAGLHFRRYFDAIFVPGERQAEWARRMGFDESRIWRGLYAADVESFGRASEGTNCGEKRFIFAGKLSFEKGISTLKTAYDGFCSALANDGRTSWPCSVAGRGPLEAVLSNPGFLKLGFVQPEDLPAVFASAGCFVLPSLSEHWGVVLHEAAAAGLPIICTRECGASVHLVQDGYNGYVVDAGSVEQLEAALIRMWRLSVERRREMGEASRGLAQQFTPERWATTILEKGGELRGRLGLG